MKSYSQIQNPQSSYPKAVLFDLLTALLDSWTVWNSAAGSEAAGRAWRAEYLRLTYGCGAYQPYEKLVRDAARVTGIRADASDRLGSAWATLPVWSGAKELLQALAPHCKLAVVTNCSRVLGRQAAERLGIEWDVVMTSEEAGFYKPDERPYLMTLQQLGVQASDAAFVSGSGYDVFETAKVGLRTYWHNRVGLTRPDGAPVAEVESPTLEGVLPWLQIFRSRSDVKIGSN